jgi:hypothetical protein
MKSSVPGYPDAAIYRWPTADEVRKLSQTHGWSACRERWWYIGERTLLTLRQGGKVRQAA